ncbi:MAG: hypothetical protein HC876_21860 [Chloroflexaceae bacterium]|nr:hypothetical protein [Chloroflexaceae bacterium]
MTYILHPDTADRQHLGGKAGALAALHSDGLPIPAWFVLSPHAFAASLNAAQRQALAHAPTSSEAQAIIERVTLTPAVQTALREALAALCPDGALVAVRSSAGAEDGAQHSYAGQFESVLNVAPTLAAVTAAISTVWRSGFSERVAAYRQQMPDPLHQVPAVLIQRMVHADSAGVAFSADPVSGRQGVAVVAATRGLAADLVNGATTGDTYYVNHDEQIIACETDATPILADEWVQQIAALARQVAQHCQRPQDIEWAIADGRLYLLQARPITTLADLPDPDGFLTVWDNSNISESYAGITTPLTFSFARRAYTEVYQQFCQVVGVPQPTIAANADVFRTMIGLIRGRVYYNLLSWYRALALLPGYQLNRGFMEQMMGVKEKLPDDLAAPPPASQGAKLRDGFNLLRGVGGLVLNYARLPQRIEQFYTRLRRVLGDTPPNLHQMRLDELARYYRTLEQDLLRNWQAPIINDFFAMIFYGLLRKLAANWCGDAAGSLQNDLLAGEGGMVSAEPAVRVREMAIVAAQHPALVAALCDGTLPAIRQAMAAVPTFARLYQAYLDRFGERCMEELKLESATLHDDPLILLRAVGRLAQAGPTARPITDGTASRAHAKGPR